MAFHVGVTRDLLMPTASRASAARLRGAEGKQRHHMGMAVRGADRDHARCGRALRRPLCRLPRLTPASLARSDCRLKVHARHGVGFDNVDLAAATAKGIAVTNTPVAVRRPVAVATLTLIFALAGRLFRKHELVHTNRWNDRVDFMGQGLTARTLGLVGAGGVGQEILKLARPFFGRMIAADPYADARAGDASSAPRWCRSRR